MRDLLEECRAMMYFKAKILKLNFLIEVDNNFPLTITTDYNRVK